MYSSAFALFIIIGFIVLTNICEDSMSPTYRRWIQEHEEAKKK